MNERTDSEIEAILAVREEDGLETVLAAASAASAARAVALAPGLERKTELLWAMEDQQRREVLERVPPALIGALVQNLEEDNRYLLGDVSFEQFRSLLALCSPERQYYWLRTALSFTDARANALPLLIPTRELTEVLLTRPEFEQHVRALADFPLEDQRLPPELLRDPAQTLVDLFGPENLLREFPLGDIGLAQLVQNLLDHDPDRYVDIVRVGLRLLDYSENRPLEYGTLVEDPILLTAIDPEDPAAAADEADEPGEVESMALMPIAAAPLARAVAALGPEQRARAGAELQVAYVRQAVAEGGSFLLADLQRVARSVEAYLLLGLAGQPETLGRSALTKLMQSGARRVEALRQVALRLRPLERVLDPEARAVVESIMHPRLTLSPDGEPRLRLLPAGKLPEQESLEAAATRLRRIAEWTDVSRAIGLDRTAAALQAAGSINGLAEELAVAAVLFARVEPGLTEPADRRRCAARYPDSAAAETVLRRTIEPWASAHRLGAVPVLQLLGDALSRVRNAED